MHLSQYVDGVRRQSWFVVQTKREKKEENRRAVQGNAENNKLGYVISSSPLRAPRNYTWSLFKHTYYPAHQDVISPRQTHLHDKKDWFLINGSRGVICFHSVRIDTRSAAEARVVNGSSLPLYTHIHSIRLSESLYPCKTLCPIINNASATGRGGLDALLAVRLLSLVLRPSYLDVNSVWHHRNKNIIITTS